jgi:hypothetical protein
MRATSPTNLILYLITLIMFGEMYTLQSFSDHYEVCPLLHVFLDRCAPSAVQLGRHLRLPRAV